MSPTFSKMIKTAYRNEKIYDKVDKVARPEEFLRVSEQRQ